MGRQLRAMVLEDNFADAELIVHELSKGGYELEWWRVESERDFLSGLARWPDVILADYELPEFDAVSALRLLRQGGLDIPLIIVSGVIEEELAVKVLKLGAADYLLKDRLTRLGSAVEHALEERRLLTEQQQSEERLRDQEKRFRALVEHSQDGIALLDTNGMIRYASPGLSRMLGHEGRELEGCPACELLPSEAHIRLSQHLSALIAGPETTMTAELQFDDSNLGSRWLEVIASNLLHQPAVGALVVNFRDITERRRAEAALRESEALFRTLCACSPVGIFMAATDGRCTYANPRLDEICGIPVGSGLGVGWMEFVHPEDVGSLMDSWMTTTQAALEFSYDYRFVRPGGDVRMVEARSKPMYSTTGDLLGYVGTLADVTEQREADAALRRSEVRYRSLVETSPEAIVLTDRDTRILMVNQRAVEMYDCVSESEMCGRSYSDFIAPGQELFATNARRELRSGGKVRGLECRLLRCDGGSFPAELSASLIRDREGRAELLMIIARDVTERKQAEQALRDSEERYALSAQGANDGLWDWDLTRNEVYFARRWKEMLGLTEHEVGISPDVWFSRVHPDDLAVLQAEIERHLAGHNEHFQNEHRMRHNDGSYRWMLCRGLAVRGSVGRAYRMAGSQTDVTQHREAQEQLQRNAFFDLLTGLPNRALLMDRLDRSVARAGRHEEHVFAVLFLDLDRFKNVNDSLGHMAGDQLLIEVARRLQTCLRPSDTVARLGGDEFTVLLDEISDIEDAVHAADRIQKQLSLPFNVNGREVFTSASIGIALSGSAFSPEAMLRDADIAMYRAKARGRSCHEVFDRQMHAHALALLQLETDLRRALERQEFQVFYQPIIDLTNGEISGFEALARWLHPERGYVSPAEFIPVAEDTGLISAIGHWILHAACQQMREWHRCYPEYASLTISVNLSARQFAQPDLIEKIGDVLRDTGLDARALKLEITESALLDNTESATGRLLRLRKMGIQLYMDDFGTGYSSLSYLHRFPMALLKIDRSFVCRIDASGGGTEIVSAIIRMANSLRMQVTGEGVETEAQLSGLRVLGCNFGQGYLFSRPVEAQSAERLICGGWQQWKEAHPLSFPPTAITAPEYGDGELSFP